MCDTPIRVVPLGDRVPTLRRWALGLRWPLLTASDVADLLTDDWLGAGPVQLNESLPHAAVSGTRMLANAQAVLAAAEAGRGLILTPRAPLGQPATVPRFTRGVRTGFRALSELPLVEPLAWTEGLLQAAGLLVLESGLLVATPEASVLVAPEAAPRLFARLFRAFFRVFNLAYLDPFPAVAAIQDLVPYWLWVLGHPPHAGAPHCADTLVWVFTPDPVQLDAAAAPARLRALIQKRVFDPLADFGLVEFRSYADSELPPELGDERFGLTPLWGQFVRFAPSFPVPKPLLQLVR